MERTPIASVDAVVRSLASAGRSLRLYPPASPIPRQSIEAAMASLDAYFSEGEELLSLAISRDGLRWHGEALSSSAAGSMELADELREHGVAELDIMPGCSLDELLGLLVTMQTPPEQLRDSGGLAPALLAAGVESVRVTAVHLTVIEQVGPAADENVDDFLRSLINDPEKLATWFAAASAGDPRAFEEGLMELVRVSGASGFEGLLEGLSGAFLSQSSDGRDALLGLAMDQGPTRDLTGGVFRYLSSGDIAGSILGGSFGRNMLSLSSALTTLPLEQVTAQVRAEVQSMLPGTGHTTKEADFLEHMLDVRERTHPEPALVEADTDYRSVLEASSLSDEVIERARGAVASSGSALNAASVRTMLSLLDQQTDFNLYCEGVDNIAGVVPRLIEQGDLGIAARVLAELSNREAEKTGPWPELGARLATALAGAVGPRSMAALVRAVTDDHSLLPNAREIARHGGDAGADALVAEAVAHKAAGIAIAEELVGRRVVDLLIQHAPQTQWFQVAAVTERLVREGDPRSLAAVEAFLGRGDEQSRREAVTGIAAADGAVGARLLGKALRDASAEVAIVAARALARTGAPGSATVVAARIDEIDIDGADYAIARELIGALARIPGAEADAALAKLASRRALIKRGHFAEVQELVRQAQQYRSQAGDRR